MAENEKKQTSSSKMNGFLDKNKKIFITILILVLVCLVGYIVVSKISNSTKEKNLAAIDEIQYTLTNESAALEEADLEARRATALEGLEPYAQKGGIVGARANLLCAELLYQQGKYEDAIAAYKATAEKSKNSYLAPLAYFNMAACYEQVNNLEEAANNYKLAADSKEFALAVHAKFSYARVNETKGNLAEAITAYTELYDKNPSDNWGKLAKTRLIALKAEGKTE